ncbi:hypothetical protein BX666DRAFT_1519269 [Dichotomocladium elegans]|nr:hypothetical protein BX666DRAFT_1519269 [Dichotomocladium elegans]
MRSLSVEKRKKRTVSLWHDLFFTLPLIVDGQPQTALSYKKKSIGYIESIDPFDHPCSYNWVRSILFCCSDTDEPGSVTKGCSRQ